MNQEKQDKSFILLFVIITNDKTSTIKVSDII